MEKMIYEYDLDKVFVSETVEKFSPLDGSLIVPQFYTEVKPVFNSDTHFAMFDENSQTWNYKEFSPLGVFYNKKSMAKIEIRSQYDADYAADLYTNISPLQEYEDGTIQVFNDTLQAWEYTEKGEILLEKERLEALEIAKKERLTQLQKDYNASKVIVIQNGETITIKHDTKEREWFWKNIEIVLNETTEQNTVLVYRQLDTENLCQYKISLVCYVWKYIFSDLFLITKSSGFKESIRSKNEGEYTFAKFRITNSQTIEGLNAVSYNFINPQGLIIDISVKAQEMFENPETPDYIKSLITNSVKADDKIHLIEKELCQ